MTVYRTRDGDVVDAIAWAQLGDVEAAHGILAANPQLQHHGAVLPAGVELTLSDAAPAPATRSSLRLWGTAR